LLARAGSIGILIDAPLVRPGAVEDKDPLSAQDSAVTEQQAVDFRRALDLPLARGDVDPKRIAYVDHSFDAKVGDILDGVDNRISTFVLMAGSCGDAYYAPIRSSTWDAPRRPRCSCSSLPGTGPPGTRNTAKRSSASRSACGFTMRRTR
jgi:hypothetical protein